MGQLVLLVVAAAWAAVLVPPLLRSRIENRPNSSVSDFRDQLSSLQRAMPSRGVAMRSMGRPLAPSPLSRPAAAGRPGLRSAGRSHNGTQARLNQPVARPRRAEPVRTYDATPRARSHADGASRQAAATHDALKRRRANVLFVLALTAGSTLFLAATTKAQAMLVVSIIAFAALLGYVYVLGQHRAQRHRDLAPAPQPVARRSPQRAEVRRHGQRSGPAHRQATTPRSSDRWSHAV
jgi:hypothetical protein